MIIKTPVALLILITSFISPVYADEKNLLIENAWIAEAPPVSKVMVAYMTIKNTGSQTIEVVQAESAFYSSIEFHETRHENGLARMIRHGSLSIPANGRLELKRGGPHLMLFNPTQYLKAGDAVNIKLTTKNNETITVPVVVKKAQF
jgi:hypothetical protein